MDIDDILEKYSEEEIYNNALQIQQERHKYLLEQIEIGINSEYECTRVVNELEYCLTHELLNESKINRIVNKYRINDMQKQLYINIYTARLKRLKFYKAYKRIRKKAISRKLNLSQIEILVNNTNLDEKYKGRILERLKK